MHLVFHVAIFLHPRFDTSADEQVDYSILDGPGAHLTNDIFLGDTVRRETFVAQFVFDVANAANISTSRVLVLEIAPGRVHHDWEVGRSELVCIRFGFGLYNMRFLLLDFLWSVETQRKDPLYEGATKIEVVTYRVFLYKQLYRVCRLSCTVVDDVPGIQTSVL